LKQFYDEDIIDEETLIEWSQKESKKYVSKEMSKKIHEKVAPFIKWLKEAEVEDDDDEEESEEEVKPKPANNNTGKPAAQFNSTSASNGQKKQPTHNDDEDDDDDDMFEFSHRVSGIQIQEVKPIVPAKPINADVVSPSTNANGGGEEDIDIDNI
jgi:hypothetical protein